MDFYVGQGIAITKVIIALIDISGGSNLVEDKACGGRRFEDSTMVFMKVQTYLA